ncbi:cytochrome c oxidase subunit 3 family protein [Ochrobactrum sp. CGA5]|uniref:cytochrome c oxidase subunit 3 family protein n=1 Tax=Ochrobactrum sp. CGA5 TaxID=2583453 RepID=UPI001121155B|nr:cytochrome c oxidase subunit 3 family protein [Ochrobactrum sp. CGA5]
MSETENLSVVATNSEDRAEGDLLLWILVWSELAAFAILLIAFIVMSVINVEGVAQMRAHLSPGFAATNTVVLLMSGWQAAIAVRMRHNVNRARRPLLYATFFGLVFVAIKLIEYSHEIQFASDESAGSFFELYFLLTGFHLMHVAFGSVVLALVAWRPSPANILLITTLWHAIDLVWLVMFPVLYLA